jgi:TIR domain/Protein of unknown function (DUF1566)
VHPAVSDIFISYARPDRAKAQVLAKALAEVGWSVWWDPKIPPGKTFDDVIEQALEAAKCIIVLWSKESVISRWVKAEASEGDRRRILVPALIEDEIIIPLAFRSLHASRLTDWQGEQMGHLEFDELKRAVADLLGDSINVSPSKASAAKPTRSTSKVAEGVYLDPKTKLMWTIEDNGRYVNWHEASEYARQLRLGGYSDWRLPTIEELKQLYDPGNKGIREPFQLTSDWVWTSTREGTGSAWAFLFLFGKFRSVHMDFSDYYRALCVRRSGE